jgi:hypothetical protein
MTQVNKYLLLLILWVMTTSCKSTQQYSSKVQFEENFNTRQIETFQALVQSFSYALEQFYGADAESNQLFEHFLRDVVNEQVDLSILLDITIAEKYQNEFKESGLLDELYVSPEKKNSTFDEHIVIQKGNNVNDLPKPESDFQFNQYGKYMIAMREAAKSDQLVNDYVNAKLVSEMIPAKQLAKGLLYSMEHNETNDYILMSILVVEFYVPLLIKTQ